MAEKNSFHGSTNFFSQSLMNNNQADDQWVRNQFKIQEFLVRMLRQRSSINIDEKAFLSLYNRFLTLNTKEPINWDQVQHPGEQHVRSINLNFSKDSFFSSGNIK